MKGKPRQIIEGEVHEALRLHERFGEALFHADEIRGLLENYRKAIARTSSLMLRNGVVEGCTVCAAQPRGSCCFSGIEEGFDEVLLLINLLLGKELPDAPELPESCYFVGKYGCKLAAKSYFCLHYLCPGLQEALGPAGCRDLLRVVGEELSAGWELEQAVRRWIGKHGERGGFESPADTGLL
ncbi:hypothetical protein [Desulforhabdus sp. TSK]|uniref:hypothetical protein n=1 Tax=Desulforhabdus sp. TSK TaxID=2925014 RepID=UPI001FC84E2E|nr:hypothetical protein [Desulforhabdus sp. TSK]GKT09809.1 hypothetical protein DSTSK_31140 [Desulforhabdus sp. TSK]